MPKQIKHIESKDVNILMAIIAIGIKSRPSTMALVLKEIIDLSENAMIEKTAALSPFITKKLSISDNNYRAALHKLYKMKLLVKKSGVIFLAPTIRTPFTEIRIKKK